MRISFPVIMFSILFMLVGCTSSNVGGDIAPSTGESIVKAANRYLKGSPDFFIPPQVWGYDQANVTKNTSGAVGYTYGIQLGDPNDPRIETIDTYRERLKNATVENQTSYSQYLRNSTSGFPAPVEEDNKYKAGFICYVMTYRIYQDAGYSVTFDPISYGCDRFLQDNNFTQVTPSNAEIGDVVVYDLDKDNAYDHMGVVSDIYTGETDYKNYYVISVFASVEFHEFGARENTVGAYEHTSRGGVYSYWSDDWANPTIDFYRK